MAHVIAVAGKGGVGKTTLCGLLIQYRRYPGGDCPCRDGIQKPDSGRHEQGRLCGI